MSGRKILLDTNAALYFLNGFFSFQEFDDLYLSFISEVELLCYPKISDEENIIIKNFIKNINIININAGIKNETISIKKDISLKLPDAIILATAKTNNLILLTNDKGLLKYNNYKDIEIEKCF